MDITSLYNVSSGVIKNALQTEDPGKVNDKSSDAFGVFCLLPWITSHRQMHIYQMQRMKR